MVRLFHNSSEVTCLKAVPYKPKRPVWMGLMENVNWSYVSLVERMSAHIAKSIGQSISCLSIMFLERFFSLIKGLNFHSISD